MAEPHENPPDGAFREMVVERLVLKEPGLGRARAILEVLPPRDEDDIPRVHRVRLSLLDAMGEPAIMAEIDSNGDPVLHVGHPDHGTTVTISPSTIDLWSRGNVVASMTASEDGGRVQVCDGKADVVAALLPAPE